MPLSLNAPTATAGANMRKEVTVLHPPKRSSGGAFLYQKMTSWRFYAPVVRQNTSSVAVVPTTYAISTKTWYGEKGTRRFRFGEWWRCMWKQIIRGRSLLLLLHEEGGVPWKRKSLRPQTIVMRIYWLTKPATGISLPSTAADAAGAAVEGIMGAKKSDNSGIPSLAGVAWSNWTAPYAEGGSSNAANVLTISTPMTHRSLHHSSERGEPQLAMWGNTSCIIILVY